MNQIFLANIINGLGVALLLFAQFKIAQSNQTQRLGLLIAAGGSLLVSLGSLILNSIPIFALNFIWVGLSLYAYLRVDANIREVDDKTKPFLVIYLILLLSYVSMYIDFNLAASLVAVGYITSYILYGRNMISRTDYLYYCAMISPATFPHLLDKFSYSVMTNEILGICLCLYGYLKYQYNSQELQRN